MIEANNVLPANSDLMYRFQNGEQAAIKQLYNQHYKPLCYFAEKLVNDKTEAEDIAVETFLKLLEKRYDFDNLPDIKSFLFTATRNACFDFLRKIKRQDKTNRLLVAQPDTNEVFGEREMLTAKVLQCIYVEMENLPAKCEQVFKSLFIERKSTAAIASEMGISTQTVLNQKSRALHLLRLLLHKKGLYKAGLFLLYLFL